MSSTLATEAVTFHLSLNTAHLGRAVDFFRVVFGQEPAKHFDDYAKFEIEDPAVILSLVPQSPATATPRGQFGFEVADPARLASQRSRLSVGGIPFTQQGTKTEPTVIAVSDLDGNSWRFALEGHAEPIEMPPAPTTAAASDQPIHWEHCVSHPLPERLPHDGVADEVRLTGSLNVASLADRRAWLVQEAFRALKPGGKIFVHGLMADRELPGELPKLPGLAALVSRVPPLSEPFELLTRAGFVDVQFVKLTETPWFEHAGIGLREVKVVARKPERPTRATRFVIYKGPFAEATDDHAQAFPRGQRVAVPPARWEALKQGGAADQFVFIAVETPKAAAPKGCCGR
jgi:hypothetical protein